MGRPQRNHFLRFSVKKHDVSPVPATRDWLVRPNAPNAIRGELGLRSAFCRVGHALLSSDTMSSTVDQTSKSECLQRLRDGDPDALGELFAEHQQRLLYIIRGRMDRRLAARVDAEDVLQEVFLDAASRVRHFVDSHPGSFFIWLRLVMNQTLANSYRRHLGSQMRDARRDVSMHTGKDVDTQTRPIAMQLIGHLTSPSKAAIRQETIDNLEQAIDELKPIDREAIALRHFELLDNREVAEVLGINEKAASIRYIRAIRRLQAAISPPDDPGETTKEPTA